MQAEDPAPAHWNIELALPARSGQLWTFDDSEKQLSERRVVLRNLPEGQFAKLAVPVAVSADQYPRHF
jgi:hypothetical protein